jgi:hypothetical protein
MELYGSSYHFLRPISRAIHTGNAILGNLAYATELAQNCRILAVKNVTFGHREVNLKWKEHNTAKAYILTLPFVRKIWDTGRRLLIALEYGNITKIYLWHCLYAGTSALQKRGGKVQQDYIHKVPIIFHDNLQRQSCKRYDPTTSVT